MRKRREPGAGDARAEGAARPDGAAARGGAAGVGVPSGGDREHFGTYLRHAREARGLDLADVSRTTKIPEASLALVEEARLSALPAEVFVRGFVRNHARATGADAAEAVLRYDRFLAERRARETPAVVHAVDDERDPAVGDPHGRRRLGVALLVLVLVVVATLTVSLILRHPTPAAAGLSTRATPAALRTSS